LPTHPVGATDRNFFACPPKGAVVTVGFRVVFNGAREACVNAFYPGEALASVRGGSLGRLAPIACVWRVRRGPGGLVGALAAMLQ
jgi:hypothetical protein